MSAGLSTAAMIRAARTIFSLNKKEHTLIPNPDVSVEAVSVPGLANVDNIDSIWASLPEVRLHVNLDVLGAQVTLSGKQLLHVLRGSIENAWEVGRSHDGRLI